MQLEWREVRVRIADLILYQRNPRRISPDAYAKLKESLKKFGYHQRVISQPDYTVIGGHQRLTALQELGMDEITILVPNRKLENDEYRQLLIADNLPFGEFDFDMLKTDFKFDELKEWGMPVEWLSKLPMPFDDDKADDVPAAATTVISRTGDLWLLGGHKVLCGDSTNPDAVSAILNGVKPNLMVTDPPYGVEYDADWRNHAFRSDGSPIAGRAVGEVQNDHIFDWTQAYAFFPGNIAYVWHADRHAKDVQQNLEACGFVIRNQIIWAKNNFAIGRGDYHWQHEPCWYAVRNKGDWHGNRKQTTLWNIDKPLKSETGHSTQKPVECMRRPMLNNSKTGDIIYDPFLGSGTSIIAAEQCGRICYGLEISPAYVDMICRRYMQFTGKSAILQNDGRNFEEIEKTRICS